ncbi:cytochrome P450 [Sphingopyxis sp. 550A]
MCAAAAGSAPSYTEDIFSLDGIRHPYPHYRAIRDIGGAVWLPQHNLFAIGRFDGVKSALSDATTFISGRGIAVSDEMNAMLTDSIITSDGPAHMAIREREAAPLLPKSLDPLRAFVRREADELVRRLSGQEEFEAMADLAAYLPLTIVAELVGLPPEGRENMMAWSAAIFQLVGPLNEFSRSALADCQAMFEYVQSVDPARVKLGSWADRIFSMVREGEIDREQAGKMLVDLIGPALDSTYFGIGSMIRLLGANPTQWRTLKQNPELVSAAVNETLRLESPIRGFTRFSTQDVQFDDTTVPANSRVLLLYASANRDERYWGNDAETMNIHRPSVGRQLAFGFGRHSCLGMHLARLEMSAILEAMLRHVSDIQIENPEFATITSLRGLERMTARFRAH